MSHGHRALHPSECQNPAHLATAHCLNPEKEAELKLPIKELLEKGLIELGKGA